ncbi:MAG: AAA family ATPase [Candidatus Dormibacteraeota bacterium]|nr:AAA family ATPase [Candidatus Dormibacteraeota bacterium]
MENALCPVLIGRESELSELEDALLDANRGGGKVVLLSGDAGMGKTRLATEIQSRARQIGMTTLWGGSSEADLELPYLPFVEALGNQLSGPALEGIRRSLGPVRRELAHLFPQLEIDLSPPDVESQQGKLRLFEAILVLLTLLADGHGLLLVIEDLHWADASTLELLDYMTRRLRSSRIMVLGTYRSDELHRKHPLQPMIQGWRRAGMRIIELKPLDADRVADMVHAIFDVTEVGEDTRRFLHARSEGNPFVLEEILKAAIDRGDFFRTESGWGRKELSEMRVPETVKANILLRLHRLSQDQVAVLRIAAVLGTTFSYESLETLSGLPERIVQEAVEIALQQQLFEDNPRVRGGYRFRHALTREVIYDDIIAPVQQRLHDRAARHLAEIGAPAVDVSWQLLAAGRGEDAVPLCLEAAQDAEAAYAHADAVELYRRALPFVRAEPELSRLLCRLGGALHADGQSPAAKDYLLEGIRGIEAAGGSAAAAWYRLILGRCHWELNRSDLALVEYERAREELEKAGPSHDLAVAYVRLAGLRLFQFDLEGCERLARRAMEIAEASGADGARIWAMGFLGSAIAGGGNDEGLDVLDRSFEEAVAAGHYSIAENMLVNSLGARGSYGRAAEVLDRLVLFERLPPSSSVVLMRALTEANALWAVGQPARAAELHSRALDLARELGVVIWTARATVWLVEDLTECGRLEEAASLVPDLPDFQEAEEINARLFTIINFHLAKGELEEACREARTIFDRELLAVNGEVRDVAVAAFLAAGDREGAERVAGLGAMNLGEPVAAVAQELVKGRFAIADGRLEMAAEHFRGAAAAFESWGYLTFEANSRLLLAQALIALDQREEGIGELMTIAAQALPRGAGLTLGQARAMLAKLGVDFGEAELPGSPAGEPLAVGERFVTVIFADIRGYTALTRESAPADLLGRIAAYQRWAAGEIGRHRGIVDKFAGDAVMATFNVSGATVDHASQALEAALAIRDKAATLGLPLGIGIATGPAVVGALTRGANVSVLGEATNLASRLQEQAGPGEILVDIEAHRRAAPLVSRRRLRATPIELELKGFDLPVSAFRLTAGD